MASAEDTTTTTSIHTPHEIIVEILSRLPAKSVLRFRSVCKSWASLIFDTHFVNKHLSNSSNRKHILYYRRSCIVGESGTFECPLESTNPQSRRCIESRIQSPECYSQCIPVGSCNGLVCLAFDSYVGRPSEFILWNPSTGDCSRCPRPWRTTSVLSYDACGFGYDYYTNDYKLLIKPGGHLTDVSLLYKASTNSWSRVWDFPNCLFKQSRGCLANGVLHWITVGYDPHFSGESSFIFGYNLGKETYLELRLPGSVGAPLGGWSGDAFGAELGVIQDRLSFVDHGHDVWMMREYGTVESWTKIFTFADYLGFPQPEWRNQLFCRERINQLLRLTEDGEVLIYTGNFLAFYNIKEFTLEYVFNDSDIFNCHDNIIVYDDSLASACIKDSAMTQTSRSEDAEEDVEEWFSIINNMFSTDF